MDICCLITSSAVSPINVLKFSSLCACTCIMHTNERKWNRAHENINKNLINCAAAQIFKDIFLQVNCVYKIIKRNFWMTCFFLYTFPCADCRVPQLSFRKELSYLMDCTRAMETCLLNLKVIKSLVYSYNSMQILNPRYWNISSSTILFLCNICWLIMIYYSFYWKLTIALACGFKKLCQKLSLIMKLDVYRLKIIFVSCAV